MEKTKITMKVHEKIFEAFSMKIEAVHLKRDAYLNHVLKCEIKSLSEELKGKKQSTKARRYVSGELNRLNLKTINVVVDKEVAARLNFITKEHNLVRDAFVNRLFLYLLGHKKLLSWLELPEFISQDEYNPENFIADVPTAPLDAVDYFITDPLYHLRLAANERFNQGLYLLDLPNQYDSFSCFIGDEYVPGTIENKKHSEKMDELLVSLDSFFVGFSGKSGGKA